MALYILDTGIPRGWMQGTAFARAAADTHGLNDPAADVAASVASQAELLAFALRGQWQEKRREKLTALFRKVLFVPIEKPSLVHAFAELKVFAEGKHPTRPLNGPAWTIGDNDLWIAATTYVLRAELVTTDKDFTPFHGEFFTCHYFDPRADYSSPPPPFP